MSTDTTTTSVSAEEYLAAERAALDEKHEWIDGELREMTGASFPHNVLVWNLAAILKRGLNPESFMGCIGDMKVRVPDGPYFYPDLVVVPRSPVFEDERTDIVLNPLVVIEVLSPSTESFDRGEKLDAYRRIPSLTDYLLVEQGESRVDHHTRAGGDRWTLTIHRGPEAVLRLPGIGCELPLAEVYERVLD